jgi:MerR family transcriptional regulator, copper efflux regulator
VLFEEIEMNRMTISKAAREAGVGVETIRFYERKGLIAQPAKPKDSGFREYPTETVQRIHFIRLAQEIGFSLREIEELLSLRADPAADCSDVRERATAKLTEVDRKIAQLEQIRGALKELIAACPGRGALRACSILEALSDAEEGGRGANGKDKRSR